MIAKKDGLCDECPLQKAGGSYRKTPTGDGASGVMFILDWDTPEQKVNAAGMALLERILRRIPEEYSGKRLELNDFRVAHLVSCCCDEKALKKETAHITHCRRNFLDKEIAEFKPKAMVVFGSHCLRAFSGESDIDYLRGYQFEHKGIPFVPTHHPRNVVKGKLQFAEIIQLDILKALHIAKNGRYKFDRRGYLLDPGVKQLEAWVEEFEAQPKDTPLSVDIETPYADKDELTLDQADGDEDLVGLDASYKILRIGFGWRPGNATSFPFQYPYTVFAKRLLASHNPKIGWNHLAFDNPRLEANHYEVAGEQIDGMHLWHFFKPSLPMGLKFAANLFFPEVPAWKLESETNPALYNAVDVDAALRACLKIKALLIEQGRWETFQTDFIELSGYLRMMHNRGVKVDVKKRDYFLRVLDRYGSMMLHSVQRHVPDVLKPKKVWKTSKERLIKEGKWKDSFIIVKEEAELKPNQMLDPEGFIIPKPKEKKPKKAKAPKQTTIEGTDPKPLDKPKRQRKPKDASLPLRRRSGLQPKQQQANAGLPTQQGLFDSHEPQDGGADSRREGT